MKCKMCGKAITTGEPYIREKGVHRACLFPAIQARKFTATTATTKRILRTPEWVWQRFGWTAAIVELSDGSYAIVEHPLAWPIKVLARPTITALAEMMFSGNEAQS